MPDEARTFADRAWFEVSGHCGGCGDPGNYCRCTPRYPCGCRDLHPMGSGLVPDALDQFTETTPVEVSDEQAELF